MDAGKRDRWRSPVSGEFEPSFADVTISKEEMMRKRSKFSVFWMIQKSKSAKKSASSSYELFAVFSFMIPSLSSATGLQESLAETTLNDPL
jgi:hypothetical protein